MFILRFCLYMKGINKLAIVKRILPPNTHKHTHTHTLTSIVILPISISEARQSVKGSAFRIPRTPYGRICLRKINPQ